jgi:uncharacterized repeat protein (TIGR03803 family)
MVYKLDPAGNFSLLFNGGSSTGLVRDSAGNLYGTNWTIGPGQGTVNKLDPSGQETTLYSFTYGPDGMNPCGALIRDAAGNLFGTASLGGTTNNGMVFKLDTAGHETVLHSFTGADGDYPVAGLVRDAAGNFYGTTLDGGPWNRGVVYKLSTGGQLPDLYAFTGAADGGSPGAGVTLDSAGNLYGTAGNGGATQYGGVVFQLDTTGHLTVLHAFTGGSDGANPYAGVIRDAEGNLYGTTLFGGNMGLGVVYKVAKTGNETVLHSFSGSDGANPFGGLIRDSAGNLYGTTEVGGAWGAGTVYKLDPQGGLTTLYSFTGAADGAYPHSGVVRDSAGNLYGTAWGPSNSGLGVVYKVDPNGQETVLYSFTGGIDGGTPFAGVVLGAGTLYGVTMGGGDDNAGVVFSVPD